VRLFLTVHPKVKILTFGVKITRNSKTRILAGAVCLENRAQVSAAAETDSALAPPLRAFACEPPPQSSPRLYVLFVGSRRLLVRLAMPRRPGASKAQDDAPKPDLADQKLLPPQYLLNSVRNLLCLGAGLEAAEHDVVKADAYAELLLGLVRRHGTEFDKGENGYYTHPLLKELCKKYEISGAMVAGSVSKVQVARYTEDALREVRKLIPVCYTAACLDDMKKLKSGKTKDDLAVDIKRAVWKHKLKSDDTFDSSAEWHVFHLNLLGSLVFGPFTEYFSDEHKMHPAFHNFAQGAAEADVKEIQKAREQDRALGRQARRRAKMQKLEGGTAAATAASHPAAARNDPLVRFGVLKAQSDNLKYLMDNLDKSDPQYAILKSKLIEATIKMTELDLDAAGNQTEKEKTADVSGDEGNASETGQES